MGRRGSQIIPFLMEGLEKKRYINLKFENSAKSIFSISLPHKTPKLNAKCEQILKDWRALKKQPYMYSTAKQAVECALKNSIFLERISLRGGKSIYRMLNESEIKEKERTRKAKVVIKEDPDSPSGDKTDSLEEENINPPSVDQDTSFFTKVGPPSVDSSGYGSGVDSPASTSSQIVEENWDIKHAIPLPQRDHDFLRESSFVNPNDILIDLRNTPSSELNCQTHGSQAMEVDDTEQVLGPYEQNRSPESSETVDSALDDIINSFLGSYNLQDAFAEISLNNSSGSDELDELMKSTVCSLISSSDHNLEAQEKIPTKVYRFKESKILDDGEIWIFNPEVILSSFNGNQRDPSFPRLILNNEQFQRMQTCSVEVRLLDDLIYVTLKCERIGNLMLF